MPEPGTGTSGNGSRSSPISRSQWKWLAISVLFSTIVLILVLYFTVNEDTFLYLKQLNPVYLVAAVGLHLLALGFWAMRIRKMAGSLGYQVGFFYCLNMVMANLLVAAITPSQAGGEPVRIHQLYRKDVPLGDATAIVMVERVIDAVLLGVLGAFALVMLGSTLQGLPAGLTIFIYLSWLMMSGAVLLFVYTVRKPDMTKRLIQRISGWFARTWDRERVERMVATIDREVDNFHQSVFRFVRHAKMGLVWGTFYSLLFWLTEFVIVSFILMGLGAEPVFLSSLVAQIIIAIVMMIPLTPGASGIAEVSATYIYSVFVDPAIVGVMVLIWRLIFFYMNIILGILATIPILQREFTLHSLKDPKV
ncbi:MAG: flippase-like domain-containing protein [Methanomicrobiales archaeon]|nr:flippase-like domain-containing protein [Methanomicrobiales archaeon]MDD1657940.1 flippase-like domain-containing protein [Methanomicrobiales archaeon]